MKCPRCHVALPTNTRFCPSCGLAVQQPELSDVSYLGAHFAKAEVPPEDPEPLEPPEPMVQQAAPVDEPVQEEVLEEAPKSMPDEDVPEPEKTDERPAADQAGSVPSEEPADRASGPAAVAPGYDVAYAPPMEGTKLIAAPRRIPKVIVAILTVGALGVGGWAGYNAWQSIREREEQEQRVKAAVDALKTPQAVDVVLGIPNSSETIDMPVGLHVVGTTRTGSSVDEVCVVTFDNRELSLLPGRYDVSLVGNVISSEGKMYSGSVDSYGITVGLDEEVEATLAEATEENAAEVAAASATSEGEAPVATFPIFVFGEVAPQDMQDADIESVRAWLTDAGIDPTPYIDAALARRAAAIEEINAEAAARLEEQERAAEEAARAVEQAVAGPEGQQEAGNPEAGDPAAQPAAEQPAAEQPAAEQPVAEQPVAEQPAEQPVAEQPVAEQPAAEQPAAEQPAAEQPVA